MIILLLILLSCSGGSGSLSSSRNRRRSSNEEDNKREDGRDESNQNQDKQNINRNSSDSINEESVTISKVNIYSIGDGKVRLEYTKSEGEVEKKEVMLPKLRAKIISLPETTDIFYTNSKGNMCTRTDLLVTGNLKEEDVVVASLMDWSSEDEDLTKLISEGDISEVDRLISFGVYNGKDILNSLFKRAHNENEKKRYAQIMINAIQNGVSLTSVDENKRTPLMASVCHEEYADLFGKLLKSMEDVNIKAKDSNELTILYYIIVNLNLDALNKIIEKGINLKDLDFISNDNEKIRPFTLFETSFIMNNSEEDMGKAKKIAKILKDSGFETEYLKEQKKEDLASRLGIVLDDAVYEDIL